MALSKSCFGLQCQFVAACHALRALAYIQVSVYIETHLFVSVRVRGHLPTGRRNYDFDKRT